jgi:hypothetical protein
MRPKLAEAEAATMAFARLSNPQDEIFTVAFNDTVRDAVAGRPLFASNFNPIAYVPPDRDGSYHRVRVQIEPADPRRLTLRTRQGYFAAGSPTQP